MRSEFRVEQAHNDKKIGVAVRLIPRELKNIVALKKGKRDIAPNVCCTLVPYHYGHLKKLYLEELLRLSCK
jgi:hypothetical protein